MLIGEYRHTLDTKKRLSLPSKMRKNLGKKVVITRGLDLCLFVYPMKEWEKVSEKLRELPMGQADMRGFSRFISSGASEVEIDSLGRILVPDYLKTFANLKNKVVLIGTNDRIELWSEDSWGAYKKRIEGQGDALAEKLGEIGAI
jgi:MraZ protein